MNRTRKVTSIGERAFYYCSGLTSVTIPNSVTSFADYAFAHCSSLTSVTIPNSVTSIGGGAFYGCSGLTSVTIPNSVTSIGEAAFQYCSSLTSVTIPNSVTSIGNYAFYNCSGLTSVTIPNNVTSIGGGAFSECSGLTSVVSLIENPFIILGIDSGNSVFSYDTFNSGTLYVPVGSIDKYKTTAGWRDFRYIEEKTGGESPTDPNAEKCATPTISYGKGRLQFSCETEGVEFISSIKDTDVKDYTSAYVDLTVTYHVSVYATKSGYQNSEVAEGTLCWIDIDPQKEGIEDLSDGVNHVKAMPVFIQTEEGAISVQGVPDGTRIVIYGIDGSQAGAGVSEGGQARIATNLPKGSIAVVKIGERSVKVKVN